MPDLSVEISWDSPDAAAPTWTDVSDKVRATGTPVQTTRGRSDERSDGNTPGTCTLVLDNADGWFTPGNSGSPYFPDVLPWRRIRVYLASGADVPLFYGYVTQWQQTWQAPKVPVVQVHAVDSLALLGRRSLRSVLVETVLADAPVAYFPLSEPAEATRALDACGGEPLALTSKPGTTGTLEFGAGTGPAADEASAVMVSTAGGAAVSPYLRRSETRTWTALSLEAWVLTSSAVTIVQALPGDGWLGSTIYVDGGGAATARTISPAGDFAAAGSGNIADGRTHHVVGVFTASQIKVYVDGVLAGTVAATHGTERIGSLEAGRISAPNVESTVSNVAVYDVALTGTQIADHYAAGHDGFTGESTFDRIERWAGWAGVTVTNDGSGAGEALGHIPTSGRTALDCLADALRTDYGSILLASRTARALSFRDRTTRYTSTSAVTLDADLDQVDGDLTVLMDPTYVASRVTATTPTGTFTATNAATEAIYGDLGMDVSVFPANDGFATSLTEGLGQAAASPTPRIPTVTTDLLVMAMDTLEYDPTAIPEIGAPCSLVNLPPTAPDAQIDAFVEGITETVSAAEWRRSCSLSPAYPWMNVWTVEDPVLGEIEAGYVVAL